MKKILVAMSGGVDSSVAALLLQKEGHNVAGVTMCLGVKDEIGEKTKCCGTTAINDAKKVAEKLKIPHYVLDFSKELEEYVIKNFIEEYRLGKTPNPCVRCNNYLKFEKLSNYAKGLGFDGLATGHYAKIENREGFYLRKPKDLKKDQTYFLYGIPKENLPFLFFPLADYTKDEVREIAHKANLCVAEKQDSQDICFVTDKDYGKFLSSRGERFYPGNIVNKEGKILGKHKGIIFYTIGQREGLGVALGKPAYVVEIDVKGNRIVIGNKDDLKASGLIATSINLFNNNLNCELTVKVRYGSRQTKCRAKRENNCLRVMFDEPQEAVTAGQSAVLYNDDIVVGGGIISEAIK